MLLNLDHILPSRPAVIDNEGNIVTYGDICRRAMEIREQHPIREFCILSVENSSVCVKEVMAMLCSERLVPLIVNKKMDAALMKNLHATYGSTGIAIHEELSHLLPTSGSTGSPKLIGTSTKT